MHLFVELDPCDYRYHGQRDSDRENGGMKSGLFPTAFRPFRHFFVREPLLDFGAIPGLPAPIWQLPDQTIAAPQNLSVRFARDTAVRIRRSGAFAFAIGAQSASVRRPRDNRFIPPPPPARLY